MHEPPCWPWVRSTNQTPSGNSSSRLVAACNAKRVLPMPPSPRSVTSRTSDREPGQHLRQRARPVGVPLHQRHLVIPLEARQVLALQLLDARFRAVLGIDQVADHLDHRPAVIIGSRLSRCVVQAAGEPAQITGVLRRRSISSAVPPTAAIGGPRPLCFQTQRRAQAGQIFLLTLSHLFAAETEKSAGPGGQGHLVGDCI